MSSDALYFPKAAQEDAKERPEVGLSESTEGPSRAAELKLASGNAIVQRAGQDPLPLASQTDDSDERLLTQAASGSRGAIGLLFRRYRRVVRNIAQRILRDATEAEDLCQDVFVSLFQKAHLFDASKGRASSWIVQIAYHQAMNRRQYLAHRQYYNTQGLDEELIGAGLQPLIVDEIAARDLLQRMRKELSEEQIQTLELHFFEGYSLREIAEIRSQTLGNTRNRFYRGMERLRSLVFPQNRTRVRRLERKSGRTHQPL